MLRQTFLRDTNIIGSYSNITSQISLLYFPIISNLSTRFENEKYSIPRIKVMKIFRLEAIWDVLPFSQLGLSASTPWPKGSIPSRKSKF